MYMPYLNLKEIWTPLKLIGIKFYKESETKEFYLKVGNRKRRKLR